jgi:catechol 2,3-dioxygenase-like lactoylglutathione lyase family enzyme
MFGARGTPVKWAIDHVGFTVPDLDQAVAFFHDAFGCELVLRAGPYDSAGYILPGAQEPEPATLRLAILRLGNHNIELLEYATPDANGTRGAPPQSQVGAGHIALYVDDIAGAVSELSSRPGVEILGEVIQEEDGPMAGLEWVYVLTPVGLVVELIRWPLGMPYEQTSSARLAGPPIERAA